MCLCYLALVTVVLLAPTVLAHARYPTAWVVATGTYDVDTDGVRDTIRIETRRPRFIHDEEPCASCGDRVEGPFEAVVLLSSGSRRVLRTPLTLHKTHERLWFWKSEPSALALADYNGDGRIDFNLGRFVNSSKWEYGLFSIAQNGHVRRLAKDAPEIYVSPGGEASTLQIEAVPGGFRYRDFGNAGDTTGGWVFTCKWKAAAAQFSCVGEAESTL